MRDGEPSRLAALAVIVEFQKASSGRSEQAPIVNQAYEVGSSG